MSAHEIAPTDEPVQVHVSPMAHIAAPLIAFGATMIARKVLDVGYRRVTGNAVPVPDDPQVGWTRAIMWAAATAVTASVVEVAVYRIVTKRGMTSV